MIRFRITALPRQPFAEFFTMTDAQWHERGVRRMAADSKPGYPCRVSLIDAEVGERVVLLSFCHQPGASPYRNSGPIYVRETAQQAHPAVNEVPHMLRNRLLSLRAYDADHMMTGAEVVDGSDLESVVDRLFQASQASYIHVHNAKPGCYNCRIDRA